jgi:CRP-like cAMP-binding protein
MAVDLDMLGRVELFRDLGWAQLKAVSELCGEAVLQPGERVFSEGEEPRALYAVAEGEVTLRWESGAGAETPEGRGVATLGPGASFGWSSLTPPHRYSLSADCTREACRVLRVDRDELLELFEKDPEVGCRVMFRLLEVVSTRFLALEEEVARRRGRDLINRW